MPTLPEIALPEIQRTYRPLRYSLPEVETDSQRKKGEEIFEGFYDHHHIYIYIYIYLKFDNSVPSYMSKIFSPAGQIQVTRRSKNKLDKPFRKSNKGRNGLSYLGPKIWNSLNSDLKSVKIVNSFKHKIKDIFFKDLHTQEISPYIFY